MEDKRIDISTLAYDLNAIVDFIFQNNSKDRTTELHETYAKNETTGDIELVNKTISEIKTENLDKITTVRYNLVKDIMDQVNDISMYSDVDFGDDDIESFSENMEKDEAAVPMFSSMGETFCLNTLLREGMLTNINLNEILGNNE